MEMRHKLKEIYEKTRNGQMGDLVFEIDGKEYHRIFRPKERLILLGGGHIAKSLCFFAHHLEFDIVVVDDRPSFANKTRFPEAGRVICKDFKSAIEELEITACDYVAVITRGHRYDAECIRTVIETSHPRYFGLLGSKRRTKALLASLLEEGLPEVRLDEISTPIGLEIGALTVEEIAISILAQMIQYRRKDLKKGKSKTFVEETFHEDVLKDLVEKEEGKALLLVYETSGSTPVKSGCFMTVNKDFVPKGTIGGGCAENAALKAAFPLIGTGKSQCYSVSLSNDIAGEEGMVCGGNMKVYLTDL